MKSHDFRLHNEPFQAIADGRKTIESRLYDAKRQTIELGDELLFTNRADGATVRARVVGLLHASFAEVFRRNDPSKFGGGSAKELLQQINQFYTAEQQAENGVVGIEFEIIDR